MLYAGAITVTQAKLCSIPFFVPLLFLLDCSYTFMVIEFSGSTPTTGNETVSTTGCDSAVCCNSFCILVLLTYSVNICVTILFIDN